MVVTQIFFKAHRESIFIHKSTRRTKSFYDSMANREQRTNIKQLFAKDVGAVSIEGNDFVVVELRGGGEREDGTRVIALMVSLLKFKLNTQYEIRAHTVL